MGYGLHPARANCDFAISRQDTEIGYFGPGYLQAMQVPLLLAGFATAAMGLAALGLCGVIAYWVVEQRRREIGIRMAVGAKPSQVMQFIMRRSLQLITFGIGFGLVAALGLALGMRALLFGTPAIDASVLSAVSVLLTAVALLASFLPARAATRISPMEAVRHE